MFESGKTNNRLVTVDIAAQVEKKPVAIKGYDTWLSCLSLKFGYLRQLIKKKKFISDTQAALIQIEHFSDRQLAEFIKYSYLQGDIAATLAGLSRIYKDKEIDLESSALWLAYQVSKGYAIDAISLSSRYYILALAAVVGALGNIPVHVAGLNSLRLGKIKQAISPLTEITAMSIGWVDKQTPLPARKKQYQQNICICFASELVFDYLRDKLTLGDRQGALCLQAEYLYNTSAKMERLVLRGMHLLLLDQADDLLVNAANIPLEITQERSVDEINEGQARTQLPPQTMARMSYLSFVRRYMQVGGYGQFSAMQQELCRFYRMSVVSNNNKADGEKIALRNLYLSKQSKYHEIMKKMHDCIANKQVLTIVALTSNTMDEIQQLCQLNDVSVNIVKDEQHEYKLDTTGIYLVLLDNVALTQEFTGCYVLAEYMPEFRLQACFEFLQLRINKNNTGSEFRIIAYFQSLEDEKITEQRHYSSLLKFLWWMDSSISRHFPSQRRKMIDKFRQLIFNTINQTDSRLQMKKRLAQLDYEIKKGKLLSFAGR